MTEREKVAAIVGCTAVGKSAVAVEVGALLGAEIVSVDSMQIYRGMDIGTDKVPAAFRERVAHHLLDLKDPGEEVTVAEYQSLAREAIADISARGKLPLLVGGSGLYLRAIVDDFEFPARSEEVRRSLEARAETEGATDLHRELRGLDPDAAERIEPGNVRRIVRALEVIELTGRPFSENADWDRYESRYELAIAGLARPRSELDARIGERVAEMVSAGLVEEALRLAPRLGRTARQAAGYRQVLEAHATDAPDDVMQNWIVRATTRLARRQESWFKKDPRITWFEAGAPAVVEEVSGWFRRTLALP
ncbi:MAG: tRNA (adenosine(37)-N6)-dimethylallyltransferase MiaA [Actinomycetota bacterium]|nr:tRNA (adenosine(37)-N6)-dimethylallyltransferase MiaA [Actinomycetota bacterium]